MAEGDNPPIGILLCTQKDHVLAEYALAGMDNQLFVSKYQLHLPKPEQFQRELERRSRRNRETSVTRQSRTWSHPSRPSPAGPLRSTRLSSMPSSATNAGTSATSRPHAGWSAGFLFPCGDAAPLQEALPPLLSPSTRLPLRTMSSLYREMWDSDPEAQP